MRSSVAKLVIAIDSTFLQIGNLLDEILNPRDPPISLLENRARAMTTQMWLGTRHWILAARPSYAFDALLLTSFALKLLMLLLVQAKSVTAALGQVKLELIGLGTAALGLFRLLSLQLLVFDFLFQCFLSLNFGPRLSLLFKRLD